MAACGSLQHIFEKPLPENPTLLESLSWNQIPNIEESPSFTEIFGELHFKENPEPSSFPSPPTSSSSSSSSIEKYTSSHKSSDSFSSMNFDSLQLCTEGLGFESSDDVEEFRNERNQECQVEQEEKVVRRSRTSSGGAFPPPISCIGKSGKPWVFFKSYRQDGRFVLKEMRIPTQEFLHAFREDGRLKLNFVQPNDEILEEEEEEEEEDEENDNDDDDDDDDEKDGKENEDV
ncbi:hypothetical protein ACB092_08G146100 [Castanea dentata]